MYAPAEYTKYGPTTAQHLGRKVFSHLPICCASEITHRGAFPVASSHAKTASKRHSSTLVSTLNCLKAWNSGQYLCRATETARLITDVWGCARKRDFNGGARQHGQAEQFLRDQTGNRFGDRCVPKVLQNRLLAPFKSLKVKMLHDCESAC